MTDRAPRRRPGQARVFVYGSLMRGLHNHALLEGHRFIGPDRTRPHFSLVDLGAFPAMVADGTRTVLGEVWEVDAPTLARLDELEGSPRWYVRTSIVLASRRMVETYVMPIERTGGRTPIPTGDWKVWRASRLCRLAQVGK